MTQGEGASAPCATGATADIYYKSQQVNLLLMTEQQLRPLLLATS